MTGGAAAVRQTEVTPSSSKLVMVVGTVTTDDVATVTVTADGASAVRMVAGCMSMVVIKVFFFF